MPLHHLWGAALWSIGMVAWAFKYGANITEQRLPQVQTNITMAMSVIVLYIFPSIGALMLMTP